MLHAQRLADAFRDALPYDAYVRTGKPHQQEAWARVHGSVALGPEQAALVASFTRRVHVFVLSGMWCGDCSAQCPMLARIADANPDRVALRFADRDERADIADAVRINAGHRVPTALFLAEDFEFVSLLGDRTLPRYRAMARRALGAACPLPGAPDPPEESAATLQAWLDELERVHLILRLSPRLRERHGD